MPNLPCPRFAAGIAPALLLALSSLATTGCKDDTGPGSLKVDYVLGNNKTCEEVEIESVRVLLSRGDGEDRMVLYSETAPCSEGEVYIDSIDPNTFDMVVEGLDDAGIVTFDNLGTPAAERKVEIFDKAETRPTATLTAKPAVLDVRWRLGADGFGNCGSVGIDRFRISAFQVGGGVQMLEVEMDCETTGDGQGYREVADPDRVLNGTQFGEVGVQALDASGTAVGDPATFVFDPPGPGYPVRLTLECTDSGCTGSGQAD